MDAILNEHEVIKFLTNRGGRCTNFELVSNFKSVLNDPRYQAAARVKFKDIINTVATVGEYQNVKFIEIKKEYIASNDVFLSDVQDRSEPSSLSSESSRGSYSSPLTNEFQPYWRYRLATTTKVPALPSRNPELEAMLKPPSNDVTSQRPTAINRSVSESTLSQNPDVRHIHQIPGYTVGSAVENRRSSTDNTRYQLAAGNRFEENQNYGNHYVNNNIRRLSGNFSPDRMLNNYSPDTYRISQSLPYNNPGLNRSASEYYPSCVERSGHPGENARRLSYNAPGDSQRASGGYESGYNRSSYERNPEVYRERHHSDTNKGPSEINRVYNESPISKKIESMHGIHRRASNDSGYLTTPFDSPIENRSLKSSPSRRIEVDFDEDDSDIHTSTNLRNVSRALFKDSNGPIKAVHQSPNKFESEFTSDSRKQTGLRPPVHADTRIQEIMPSSSNRRNIPTHSSPSRGISRDDTSKHSISEPFQSTIPKRHSTSDLTSKALSTRSGEASSEGSMLSLNSEQDFESSKLKDSVPLSKLRTDPDESKSSTTTKEDSPPPLPPSRRRKHQDKATSEDDTKENTDLSSRDCSMASGKVRDRVQHFDDMEKKRNTKRSHSPLTPDKENRIHSKGVGTDDDVSISVLDAKLKREWFVKAAQSDYHALVALLKKEPKLAAIKDSAMGYTALHWAAKHGDANVIKLIAGAYKVNPNMRSNGGYTPVHIASLHKHEMIVHLLVHTYGADASLRDFSGKRADQYPDNYVRVVAGHKTLERRPLKQRPPEKETPAPTSNSFMRIGSLNLRKARKSTVFASVRGGSRNRNSLGELRFGSHASIRKKLHKSMPPIEKKSELEKKNDSDSDSNYGFPSKKQES